MPLYPWVCHECKIEWETKLTMTEFSAIKDYCTCHKCGRPAKLKVSPLNFRLQGEGWFGRDGGNNSKGLGYEMTQREMDKSKEEVAKMDDYAANMSEKEN